MANLGLLAGLSILLAFLAWRARQFLSALEAVTPAADTGGRRRWVETVRWQGAVSTEL